MSLSKSLPDIYGESNLKMLDEEMLKPTADVLEREIEVYKLLVKELTPHTDRARQVIRRLVHLRLQLFQLKDVGSECGGIEIVSDHEFEEKPWMQTKHYCEKCCSVIFGILQSWYQCRACGYSCHKKCLNLVSRRCAYVQVSLNSVYIMDICPDRGLHSQSYKCAECKTIIGFHPKVSEARQCDYTGLYYCNQCHWNDLIIIPPRVVHNWDFEPRKVCRASKCFLRLMQSQPVLNVSKLNNLLFTYLEDLREVKRLRIEFIEMKKYFVECEDALTSKILSQLPNRQHLFDNCEFYSLLDLEDIYKDEVLLMQLTSIHANMIKHLKVDCKTCRTKGVVCKLCHQDSLIFPFESTAVACSKCNLLVHRQCVLMTRGQLCPSCQHVFNNANI